MNTIKKSEVLKGNKEAMLLNWIKNYHWYGKDIQESFNKSLDHYAEIHKYFIELDINQGETKDYIINYVKSFAKESVFEAFIKQLLFTCYTCKNFRELMRDAELPFKFEWQLHSFILNYVIPAIT